MTDADLLRIAQECGMGRLCIGDNWWGFETDAVAIHAFAARIRAETIEECAAVITQHDKAGREWIPGSLWDTLTAEAAARIRALGEQ